MNKNHPFVSQFSKSRDYPCFDGNPLVYLIASTPRSGSHYFGHFLRSTGLMGDPLEYINERHVPVWEQRFGVKGLEDVIGALFRHRTSPNGVFGIKVHYEQCEKLGGADKVLGCFGVRKIIFLTRNDKVSQAISFAIAKQTGVWIHGDEPKGEAKYDFELIRRSFESVVNEEIGWHNFFRSSKLEVYSLSFEQVLRSANGVLNDISEFIGVPKTEIKFEGFKTEKQGGGRNIEWASRFAEEYSARIQTRPSWVNRVTSKIRKR